MFFKFGSKKSLGGNIADVPNSSAVAGSGVKILRDVEPAIRPLDDPDADIGKGRI